MSSTSNNNVPGASVSEMTPQQAIDAMGEFNPLNPDDGLLGRSVEDPDTDPEDVVQTGTEVSEAPVVAPEPEPAAVDEEADKWAEKFRQLSAKDAKLRGHEQALKQREREIAEAAAWKQEILSDPVNAMLKLGVTPEKLFAAHMRQEQEAPKREVEDKYSKLEQRIEALQQQAHQREMMRAGQEWDRGYGDLIAKDEYKLAKAWDPDGELVRQQVVDHYRATGEILPPSQALATITEALRSKVETLKAAGLFGATGEAKKPEARNTGDVQKAQPRSRTLTSTVDDSAPRRPRYMDDEEDMDRIIAKFAHQ